MFRLHIHKGVVPSYDELRDLVRALKRQVIICVNADDAATLTVARHVINGQRVQTQMG